MKFSQLIECKNKIFFKKNHAEDEAGRLVLDLLLLCKIALLEVVCSLVSIYFDSLNLAYNQNKLFETLDYTEI